jgi:amidase
MADTPAHQNTGFIQQFKRGGDGPTVVIKDSIDVAGYPTGMGSRAYADASNAITDAACVAALASAGFSLVGKSALHELALGATGINPWQGTPFNSRYPEYVPGGSSSGSAALVGAGLVEIGVGTDTGGSVRVPAACCGVIGLKTTFGLIDHAGVYPLDSTLDCIGFFARDAALIEQCVEACAPKAPPSRSKIRSIGLLSLPGDEDVKTALALFGAAQGVAIVAVDLDEIEAAFDAGFTILAMEAWAGAGHLTGKGLLHADLEARLCVAASIAAEEFSAAERERVRFRAAVDQLLTKVDVIALPTLAEPPPTLEQGALATSGISLTRYVRPFNLSGHPAIAIPLNRADNTPASLQLVGRYGDDRTLCQLAQAILGSLK